MEGGSRIYEVASSCVQLYKAGLACDDASAADTPCCTTQDKEVYANAWSLTNEGASDALVTHLQAERDKLVAGGAWKEVCHAITGPSVFCVDTSMKGGRNGPFMLYNRVNASMASLPGARLLPLHRCITSTSKHFISAHADCEGMGTLENVVGYLSDTRGWETLRALRRCGGVAHGFSHALDLECSEGGGVLLGFVR